MLNLLDNYFLSLQEPEQSCLLFVRNFILSKHPDITERWHYNTPFYHYKGRWLCYISYQAKKRNIYLGFVHGYKIKHKLLLAEGRKQIKVYYLNANQDVDPKALTEIFSQALGVIDKLPLKK